MAIYAPGRRDKHNRPLKSGKRSVVAMLSLTAMVDMFTVLVVFLLQNYNTTGEVIDIDDKVILPTANAVKELRPAHVVIVSPEGISLDKDVLASFVQVKEQEDWKIEPLHAKLIETFRLADERRQALGDRVKETVAAQQATDGTKLDPALEDRRVTVQADKKVDFLTIKKVMYTLTEAGASEINFAVMKDEKKAAN